MKPQLLESYLTGKETLHIDQDTNGADLRDALRGMNNGRRILAQLSLCETCARTGNCFIYDLHVSWRQRVNPLIVECRDYKEKPCENSPSSSSSSAL